MKLNYFIGDSYLTEESENLLAMKAFGNDPAVDELKDLKKSLKTMRMLHSFGWILESVDEDESIFSNTSPAGQHLIEHIPATDTKQLGDAWETCVKAFDIDEYAMRWLEAKATGKKSCTLTARAWLEDADKIKQMLQDTANAINDISLPGKNGYCITITETYKGHFFVKADSREEARQKFDAQVDINELDFDKCMELVNNDLSVDEDNLDGLDWADENLHAAYEDGEVVW